MRTPPPVAAMVATVTAELGWTYESSDRWVSSVNMGKILTPPPFGHKLPARGQIAEVSQPMTQSLSRFISNGARRP
jgi:hypothetical protein